MRNILKQTSYVFLAQVLTKSVGFFYTLFLARTLGVSDFGLFTVALAYFAIISSFSDFGLNRFLIREVARNKLQAHELLPNIIVLRVTLTAVTFAVFAVFLYLFDQNKLRVSLILLATLAILPQSIALTFDGVFAALRKLQFSAGALLFSSVFTALAGFFLVSKGFGSIGAVNALILGQLVYAVILIVFLLKSQKIHFSIISFPVMKKAIRGSLPYGILGVLGLLYFRIDAVLLSYLKGSFETGIYGAAYKFLEAITFIPSAISLAIFPILSKLHDSDMQYVRKLYFKSLKVMGIFGVAVLLGYILILPKIIITFLPDYIPSIQAIRILAISIPFIFAHVPAVSVLFSTDRYLKQVILLSILTLVFNLTANLIFIPSFGFIAASWITVLSEILSFIIFFLFTKSKILDK